ncbi:LysR family transcriptional regulator [Chengkuizengella sediminis]|uniref:LysR family transcriptional regulator n=1 Tax=Chengkuizengella sediminis TaxID=1885917 RepID=UPI00138A57ED|nr:LysR family transcriptional regulator [Chengkuizengella sediminis]NDI34443.1 LysR family transcriptional regulator [Chengkuizengella sediminis]
MELRQLQYSIQIALEKNFSRAAEKLHVAQPSLSQQIAKLEKELNVKLFDRNTNAVELTHAGAVFVEKAHKVMDLIEQMKNEMEDISHTRKGKLIIGSLPITGSHILPRVLPIFQQNYPGIEIMLIEESSTNLEILTSQGQTDISLLSLPMQESSLTYYPVMEEEIILTVPPKHHLNTKLHHQKKEIDIIDLKDEPFVTLKKGQGFRHITIDLCEQAGFTPNIAFESSNIETVQSLVAAGMGIAFVPYMVTQTKWSHFTPIHLKLKHNPKRTLVIAHQKGRYLSKAAEAFIDTMMKVIR